MKKRVLCIILALVMVLPLVLASCNEKSEEDKMKDIILGTDGEETERAYTLSLWIPTNKITIKGKTADLGELSQKERKALELEYPDVYEFLLRVDAVEDAINKILVSRNFYTHIDIVPVYDEYYEEAVKDRFASMSAESKPGDMNQRGDSDEYTNEVTEEAVGDSKLYKLLYRPVDSKQLDLFLIRSYADYVSYIDSNYLLPLDKTVQDKDDPIPTTNYLTSTGSYTGITKLIRTIYLSQMKYGANKYTYALPNNHLYADQYQYILVNKELFGEYSANNEQNEIKTIADLQGFIEYVGALNNENTVGLVANYNDAHGFVYVDNELLIGGTQGSTNLGSAYDDENYNAFVSLYKELSDKGFVSNELADGKTAGVQIVYGTSKDVASYEDDYMLIKSAMPVVNTEDVFASMFAISTFSVDFDRSMKILNLLLSDSEIRTLIQYGIENEDYTIKVEVDEDKKEIEKISINDTAYKDAFQVMYTGNSYYTYPSDNTEIDDWDYEKQVNLDAVISSYFKFDYYLQNGDLTAEERAFLLQTKAEVTELLQRVDKAVEGMTAEEFASFLEVYKTDIFAKLNVQSSYADQIASKNDAIAENNEKIANKQAEINAEYEKMAEAGTKDTYESLKAEITVTKAEITELSTDYETNKDKIAELQATLTTLNTQFEEIGSVVITLEKELDDLNTNAEKLNGELVSLQELYDNSTNEINGLKAKSEIAFELKTSETYFDIIEIYQKVLTFCK